MGEANQYLDFLCTLARATRVFRSVAPDAWRDLSESSLVTRAACARTDQLIQRVATRASLCEVDEIAEQVTTEDRYRFVMVKDSVSLPIFANPRDLKTVEVLLLALISDDFEYPVEYAARGEPYGTLPVGGLGFDGLRKVARMLGGEIARHLNAVTRYVGRNTGNPLIDGEDWDEPVLIEWGLQLPLTARTIRRLMRLQLSKARLERSYDETISFLERDDHCTRLLAACRTYESKKGTSARGGHA